MRKLERLDTSLDNLTTLFSKVQHNFDEIESNGNQIKEQVTSAASNTSSDLITRNYRIVNFGDSIVGNFKGENSVSGQINIMTGATTYNCGFSNCQMSLQRSKEWSAFSMISLAQAIASKDYSAQEAAANAKLSGMRSYFTETIKILKSLDFSNIDIITIAYGTDDYTAGKALEDSSDLLDNYTFAGALRNTLITLMSAYPNLKIILVAPTWRYWMNSKQEYETDSDTRSFNASKNNLKDFVNKCLEIGREYHVPVVNPYDNLSINRWNYKHWFNPGDGTRPNQHGRKTLARLISATINSL